MNTYKKFLLLISSLIYVNANVIAQTSGQTAPPASSSPASSPADSTLAPVYIECKQPGKVALTFDDGPNLQTTPIALEILKKNDIKATFFVNGQNYGDLVNSQETKDLLKRQYSEGHDIGSHTFKHTDCFESYSNGGLNESIDMLSKTVKSILNLTPAFFRPPNGNGGFTKEYCTRFGIPYNETTEVVRKALGERKYKVIMWNADTRDWNFQKTPDLAITELDRSIKAATVSPSTNSFIALMHDVHQDSVEVILQKVIDDVKAAGYQFTTLAECIGESPYVEQTYEEYMGIASTEPTSNLNNNAVPVTVNDVKASATTKSVISTLSIILFLFAIIRNF